MSLANAFNTAVTGLQASARGVGVTSSNIANAMVEGHAARKLHLGTAPGGSGGVTVNAITRQTDPAMAGLLRQAASDSAKAAPVVAFLNQMEARFGLPGDDSGLAGRAAALESALSDAADRPDLDYRLTAVAEAADKLVAGFNGLERDIQAQRLSADHAIAREVEALNAGLGEIARLNAAILGSDRAGPLALDLLDQRDQQIAELSRVVPIQTLPRANGQLALYTSGGEMLLDGTRPAHFAFSPSPGMTAAQSATNGGLSGLTADGRPVSALPGGTLDGGALAAQFTIRDETAPALQSALDTLATGLLQRFQAPGIDPSLPAGAMGLFSDNGAPAGTAPSPGVAGRLAINPLISAAGDNEAWRLRDGLGAAAPGAVGDPSQLQRWMGALDAPVQTVPGGAQRSFSDQIGHAAGELSMSRQNAENRQVAAESRLGTLRDAATAAGIDTDAELQTLLMQEKAYTANARTLQVIDDLFRRLLEI